MSCNRPICFIPAPVLLAWALGGLVTPSALAQTASPQPPLQIDVKPTCTVAPAAFATWFSNGGVSLDGAVKAANSLTFSPSSNCDFYRWSQQMFLWLTSPAPANYGGNGRVFDSPVFFDVSAPDANGNRVYVPHTPNFQRFIQVRSSQVGPHGLQTLLDAKGRMFEVVPAPLSADGTSMIRNAKGQWAEVHRITSVNGKLKFFDQRQSAIAIAAKPGLDTSLLARTSPGLQSLENKTRSTLVQGFKDKATGKVVFMDANGDQVVPTQGQAGSATGAVLLAQNGSLIYYATMVNDVYAFFQTGTMNGAIPSPGAPQTAVFPTTRTQLNAVVNYAASKGRTFPDPEALAVEVKTSWIEATGLDTSKYITATGTVPVYDTSNPLLWIPKGSKTTTLAMVGMHVVGSTAGHPEMVWATYEHFSNAPWSTFTYLTTAGQTKTVLQAPTGNWLLSSTNDPAAAYNIERMSFHSPNIQANDSQTIGPSDTIRWKTWGSMAGTPAATGANTDVMSINNSVITQLMAGDVRAQYMLTGTTWTLGGAAPDGSNEAGTPQLANATMETYQQGSSASQRGTNCFSCHTTNKVKVSHIFLGLKPLYPK